MADLIDGCLTIAELETARQAARLTVRASRSAGRELRMVSATPTPRAEEWSAEWSMNSARDRPEVPVSVGTGVPQAPRPLNR